MSRYLMLLRTAIVAALLMAGLLATTPVSAQDTPVAEEVTTEAEGLAGGAQDAVADDDGFDWGLLGLLGLAGLAGLMRRPQPVVHDADRTTTTTTGVGTRGPDDTTRV